MSASTAIFNTRDEYAFTMGAHLTPGLDTQRDDDLGRRAVSVASATDDDRHPAGKMVVIDGSKNPSDIPEHAYWRHCFHKLAHAKRLNADDYVETIGLSKEDADTVLTVANRQAARDDECARRIDARQSELRAQSAKPEALSQAFQDVTLDCRYRDLEARDRLLDSLSPEGRVNLRAWAEGIRRGMTVYCPANDLEQFKRPY